MRTTPKQSRAGVVDQKVLKTWHSRHVLVRVLDDHIKLDSVLKPIEPIRSVARKSHNDEVTYIILNAIVKCFGPLRHAYWKPLNYPLWFSFFPILKPLKYIILCWLVVSQIWMTSWTGWFFSRIDVNNGSAHITSAERIPNCKFGCALITSAGRIPNYGLLIAACVVYNYMRSVFYWPTFHHVSVMPKKAKDLLRKIEHKFVLSVTSRSLQTRLIV